MQKLGARFLKWLYIAGSITLRKMNRIFALFFAFLTCVIHALAIQDTDYNYYYNSNTFNEESTIVVDGSAIGQAQVFSVFFNNTSSDTLFIKNVSLDLGNQFSLVSVFVEEDTVLNGGVLELQVTVNSICNYENLLDTLHVLLGAPNEIDVESKIFLEVSKPSNYPTIATVDPLIEVCEETTSVTLFGNSPSVGTPSWSTLSGDGIVDDASASFTSASDLSIGSNKFVYSISNVSCVTYDTLEVKRYRQPTTAYIERPNIPTCLTSEEIEANPADVGIGKWYIVQGSGTLSNSADVLTSFDNIAIGENILEWRIENGACPVSSSQLAITRFEEIPAQAGDNQIVCSSSLNLAAVKPSQGLGQWINLGSATIDDINSETSLVSNIDLGSHSFIWLVTNGACVTNDVVTITRNDRLSDAEAGLDQFECNIVNSELEGITPTKGSGNWSLLSGTSTIVSVSNAKTQVKNLIIGENKYLWTVSAGSSCTPSYDTVSVWRDGFAPTIVCPSDTVISNDLNDCFATFNYATPVGVDNCPNSVTTMTAGFMSGSIFPIGTTLVSYEVVDEVGYSASCSFNVVVEDTTMPVINCPTSIVKNNTLNQFGSVVNYTIPVGTDNCNGVVTSKTDLSGLNSGSFFPVGTTILSYKTVDAVGNEAECSFNVTIKDVQKPSITCPSDIDFEIALGSCEAIMTYADPIYSDNGDDTDLTLVQTNGLPSNVNYPPGVTTNTFKVTDLSGNSSSCSFTVSVKDVEDPSILCPDDVIQTTDAGVCSAMIDHGDALGDDICNEFSINLVSGLVNNIQYPLGTTTNTYEVVDLSNNSDQCSFDVTVNDEEAPIPACQDTIIVSTEAGLCTANVVYLDPQVNDNCDLGVIAQLVTPSGPKSGDDFPVGITEIPYFFEDASGNSSTCKMYVKVVDNELPELTCQSDINATVTPGECDKIVFFEPSPFVTSDNCGIQSTIRSDVSGLSSGDVFPVGTVSISYLTTDVNGNEASCSFDVNVSDNEQPSINCPNDTVISNDLDDCLGTFTLVEPEHSDACSATTLTQTTAFANTAAYDLGSYTVSYEVEDVSGNKNSCSYSFTIEDQQIPTLSNVRDTTLFNETGKCSSQYSFVLPTVSDNCLGSTVTQTVGLSSGSDFLVGSTSMAFVAEDAAANSSDTSKFVITVIDNEMPTIDCPVVSDFTATNCDANVVWNLPNTVNNDNCGSTSLIVLNANFDNAIASSGSGVLEVGTYQCTYEVIDASGNTNQCTINFDVLENDAPVLSCPSSFSKSAVLGGDSAFVTYLNPTANDECSTVDSLFLVAGPASDSFLTVGVHTVEYKAVDALNNSSTCQFDITVLDNEKPLVTCQNDTTIYATSFSGFVNYSYVLPEATDNHLLVDVYKTAGLNGGDQLTSGQSYDYTFEAVDATGNVSNACTYSVTVEDNIRPTINCPAGQSYCGERIVTFSEPTFSDNAEDVFGAPSMTKVSGKNTGDLFEIGTHTITYQAQDVSGNVSTCSFDVIISDPTSEADIETLEQAVCDTTINVVAKAFNNGRYTWQLNNKNSIISVSNSQDIFPLIEGENTIVLEFRDGVCPVDRDTLKITRDLAPTTASISMTDSVYCDAGFLFNVSNKEVVTGTSVWSVDITQAEIVNETVTGMTIELVPDLTHQIILSTKNGVCEVSSDTLILSSLTKPTLSLEASLDTIYRGESTVITASGDYAYTWSSSNEDTNLEGDENLVTPELTSTYYIHSSNTESCQSNASIQIVVLDEIKVYTGLTPNGDNVNDTWVIKGIKKYDPNQVHIEVYSAWGRRVFESDGYEKPWDGTDNGSALSFGSYYYTIEIDEEGFETQKGVVTILK